MHVPVELFFESASSIAAGIRDGRISAVEAVDACLDRIAEVNPAINAVVLLDADGARRAARAADADAAAGRIRGPLHGVPFTAKDSLDTAGLVTTVGTTGWRTRVPERDATVVARLRAAGAILLGKTNTPEFTWSDETDNLVYGRTSNPYDLTRSPGGSSGGAAAMVASGGAPFDIGSDTGDSIRQPAHVCGVAGIKPTSGRVPRTGHTPSYRGILEGLTQLGPIARRVDDLSLILSVIAGPDGEDPHLAPVPLRDASDVDVARLRVATFTDNGVLAPTPETITTVEAAAASLADTGAHVEAVVPPGIADAGVLWQQLVEADGNAWLERLFDSAGTPLPGSIGPRLTKLPLSASELTALFERADDIRARLLRWVQDFDVILCPVMPRPAVRHGESDESWFGDTYSDAHNLTGWPSVVVRAGTSGEGLPIGVQLVAPPWREDLALAAATVVESALGGWRPPPL